MRLSRPSFQNLRRRFANRRDTIDQSVSASLEHNLALIRQLLGNSPDIITGTFMIVGNRGMAGLAYIDGLVDKTVINEHILRPLMTSDYNAKRGSKLLSKQRLEDIRTSFLTTVEVKENDRMEQVLAAVLGGSTALFIDGAATALVIDTKGFRQRSIDRPETEVSVRGGQDAFVEDLSTNFSMLRRRLPTDHLRAEAFVIGRLSRTKVRLAWLEGVINPKMVDEVRRRIQRIDVDFAYGSGLLAELIEDNPCSIWPQYRLTERPDVLAANMAEGRFAVFVDGSPFVLVAPVIFWQNLQTADDYAEKPVVGTFFRILRQVGFYTAMMGSGLYTAIVSFHQSIIPPSLAIRIAAGRAGVPLPTLGEMLLTTMAIDLLREAGVRLPRAVGAAVGILGAVVIGQAAVAAGFVSSGLIIVVAVSAIANFAIPTVSFANAVRLANYFLIILGGTLGLFGVTLGMIYLLWQVVSLRSFGIPYYYPVAPGELYGLKDTLVRAPFWQLRRRPSLLAPENQVRMGDSTVAPAPPRRGGNTRQ